MTIDDILMALLWVDEELAELRELERRYKEAFPTGPKKFHNYTLEQLSALQSVDRIRELKVILFDEIGRNLIPEHFITFVRNNKDAQRLRGEIAWWVALKKGEIPGVVVDKGVADREIYASQQVLLSLLHDEIFGDPESRFYEPPELVRPEGF